MKTPSPWNHAICIACWNKREPSKPAPPEADHVNDAIAQCCFCGRLTGSGMYVRDDPKRLECKGVH